MRSKVYALASKCTIMHVLLIDNSVVSCFMYDKKEGNDKCDAEPHLPMSNDLCSNIDFHLIISA